MTRSFPALRGWLLAATCGSAFALALPFALADDPAPPAKEGAEGAAEKQPAEAPDDETPEEPEKTKGEQMFAEAIATIQAPHESQEQLAEAIRKARGIFEKIAKLPEEDADAELRERSTTLAGKMNLALLVYGTEEEKKELVPALVEKIVTAEKITPAEYSMMGNLLEASVKMDPKLGEETLAKFKEAIASKGDENGPKALAQLEGIMRRATLVGQKLELAGTKFDGEKFDISDLKGKVVLVDFWATWCPPCRAEHPNMLTNYRKYKDKGFEIVGVSLDQDREALKEYLDETEGHWIILHDENGDNPATEYYAISGIPAMFLVDEKGVVISTEARGEELTRLLEERWGKVELPEEESADASEEKEKPDDAKPASSEEEKEETPKSEDAEK